jgi:hypothetical protein
MTLRGERVGAGALSPMVMTGLVFAGANKPSTPGRGIVTGEALVDLDLSGLDLAVLSACETGLGDVAGGEGTFGLQRAFHLAGTRDVIASLWKVPDRPTAALMALFYRNRWEKDLPPIEALRQAQLDIYRHPEKIPELAEGSAASSWRFRGPRKRRRRPERTARRIPACGPPSRCPAPGVDGSRPSPEEAAAAGKAQQTARGRLESRDGLFVFGAAPDGRRPSWRGRPAAAQGPAATRRRVAGPGAADSIGRRRRRLERAEKPGNRRAVRPPSGPACPPQAAGREDRRAGRHQGRAEWLGGAVYRSRRRGGEQPDLPRASTRFPGLVGSGVMDFEIPTSPVGRAPRVKARTTARERTPNVFICRGLLLWLSSGYGSRLGRPGELRRGVLSTCRHHASSLPASTGCCGRCPAPAPAPATCPGEDDEVRRAAGPVRLRHFLGCVVEVREDGAGGPLLRLRALEAVKSARSSFRVGCPR